ncbi:HAMP domain-containing histidine kinase (plasmid) [Natrinema zhouii]|uniref:sensor histidine kinase n=1 Tax=Natrinema zhouii TaxID=1710539 RepID=UPI001CFF844D|nr:HAMP domain-containing sensor histidine kinase [Natrinema zhouii]UHQ98143.1 HAMP domain-containing histidine kinase [Natrinema zhouii]
MATLRSVLNLSPLKISAGYLIFGVVWIPTTDILLAVSFGSQQMPTLLGLTKGWTFIGLSTLLIFALSYLHQQQMASTQTKLQTANQQLQVLHRVFRHNIRNDLNVVLGYSEILSERVSERQSQSYLKTIRRTTEQVIGISEKLKVVENIDPTLSNEKTVNLVDLVDTELQNLSDAHPDVTISTELPGEAWIQGDESLRYAIRELLENAVVHNDHSKGECDLLIQIDRVNGEHLLKISDNGPGIPQEELQPLQLQQETPLIHASSVGLWLVTWLTRLHAGAVEFNTDDGTTVTLQFQAELDVPFIDTNSRIGEQVRRR